MRDVLERHVDDGYAPGVIAVVARRGEVHIEAVGRLAFEGRGSATEMSHGTLCRVASWTKTVVAACTMTLVEDGIVRLNDPVERVLPELADMNVLRDPNGSLGDTVPAHRQITVLDLLTCRMGTGTVLAEPGTVAISDALNALESWNDPTGLGPTATEYVRRLGELPLVCQPGERWMYYIPAIVLGLFVSRVTGQSLQEALRERVFEPLGMHDSHLGVGAEKLDRLATAYTYDPAVGHAVAEGVPDQIWIPRAPFKEASSGLVSTPQDFLAFASALLAGGVHGGQRILSRPSVTLMTSNHLTAQQRANSTLVCPPGFSPGLGWGFAVGITSSRTQLGPSVGSYGWYGKYGTPWFNDPAEEMTTMFLRQTDTGWTPTPALALEDFWTAAYQAIDD